MTTDSSASFANSSAPSASDVLAALEMQPGWDQWGDAYWTRAMLSMAAKAGARLGRNPKAAELALSSLQPKGEDLTIALSLAARCGSIEQMKRFIDRGANVLVEPEELDTINKKQQAKQKEADADSPVLPSVLIGSATVEALKAGRHEDLLWLLEEQKAPLPNNPLMAPVELLKWAPDRESPTTLRLRDLFFSHLTDAQRTEWNEGVCAHLVSIWGQAQRSRELFGSDTPEGRLRDAAKQRQQVQTVFGWVCGALSWGGAINPTTPRESTALGWAVAHGSVEFAQKLVDIGADPLSMRYNERDKQSPTPIDALTHALSIEMFEWGFANGLEPSTPEQWTALRTSIDSRASKPAQREEVLMWLEARELATHERRALHQLLDSDPASTTTASAPSASSVESASPIPSGTSKTAASRSIRL